MKVSKVIGENPFKPFCITIHVETEYDYDGMKQELELLCPYLIDNQFDIGLTMIGKIAEAL